MYRSSGALLRRDTVFAPRGSRARLIETTITATLRSYDLIVRLGGDEFL